MPRSDGLMTGGLKASIVTHLEMTARLDPYQTPNFALS
jgi:hypothetical protein